MYVVFQFPWREDFKLNCAGWFDQRSSSVLLVLCNQPKNQVRLTPSYIKSCKVMSCVCGYVTSPNTWVNPSTFCIISDVTLNHNRTKKGAVKFSKNEMCCYIFLNMNAFHFLAHHAAVGVLCHYLGLFRLTPTVFIYTFSDWVSLSLSLSLSLF